MSLVEGELRENDTSDYLYLTIWGLIYSQISCSQFNRLRIVFEKIFSKRLFWKSFWFQNETKNNFSNGFDIFENENDFWTKNKKLKNIDFCFSFISFHQLFYILLLLPFQFLLSFSVFCYQRLPFLSHFPRSLPYLWLIKKNLS